MKDSTAIALGVGGLALAGVVVLVLRRQAAAKPDQCAELGKIDPRAQMVCSFLGTEAAQQAVRGIAGAAGGIGGAIGGTLRSLCFWCDKGGDDGPTYPPPRDHRTGVRP